MNTDPTNTPNKWSHFPDIRRIPESPDPGEWYSIHYNRERKPNEPAGANIIVWHWHRPTGQPERWMGAILSAHTILSTDPETLHFEPSLGCDDGCPAHGWVRDGRWIDLENH